jgi:HD-GYP domain-containing protein (c-di-GMP phosphodiesterase class II)
MLRKLTVAEQTTEVVHTVIISVLAVLVLTVAMTLKGWDSVGWLIAAAIGLIVVRIVVQVWFTVGTIHSHNDQLLQASRQAQLHYIDVLKRIVRFSEIREGYDGGRSERIARLCCQMGEKMGLEEEKIEQLSVAGWLHDIGLLAVPEQVLHKATRLSGDEFRSVKRHAETSYEVLEPLDMLRDVLPAIRHHHERANGTGYPDGLRGEAIPLEARILAVADTYDALTHDRPHRPAMSSYDAVKELQRCSPAGFDPDCVEALAEVVNLPQLAEALEPSQSAESPVAG